MRLSKIEARRDRLCGQCSIPGRARRRNCIHQLTSWNYAREDDAAAEEDVVSKMHGVEA